MNHFSKHLAQLEQHSAHRRNTLRLISAASGLAILGCGGGSTAAMTGSTAGSGTGGSLGTSVCVVIPSETAGPFPSDGTNGPNALTLSGVNRADIRSSIAGVTGTATGIPLTLNLTVQTLASSCAPIAGYVVYLWHCDAAGAYSMYSGSASGQNYLRGIQVTNASGLVSFTTIYPGCYPGRVPHMHFEVYPNLASAVSGNNDVKTSQLTFPVATSQSVYALSGYGNSASNLASSNIATDFIFSDGYGAQIATIAGTVASNLTASLTVVV